MIRGRTIDIKTWLYGPFLYYAVHHPADDPYRQLVQPFVDKALRYGNAHIRSLESRHRHHGTWYALRTGTAAAFCIIAAAKCGHINLPETWAETVQLQVELLRYWEEEAPDIAKSRVVLQEMIEDFS
jgi:hypothetical protein